MTESRKLFLPIFAAAMAGCASAALAQSTDAPENVLFKVHDVQSVKNADGVIDACDYNVTFYNRSPNTVKAASLNLSWHDDTISSVISDEKTAERKKSGRNTSKTEEMDSTGLTAVVDVPPLEPYKQTTVRSRVRTDKCFIMLDDLKFTVRSCNIVDKDSNSVSTRARNNRDGGSCDGVFLFISATNPEYYQEFKPISYEEDMRNAENQRMEGRRKIDDLYNQVVAEMNNVATTINEIQSDAAATASVAPAASQNAAKSNEVSDAELSAKLKTLFPGLGEPEVEVEEETVTEQVAPADMPSSGYGTFAGVETSKNPPSKNNPDSAGNNDGGNGAGNNGGDDNNGSRPSKASGPAAKTSSGASSPSNPAGLGNGGFAKASEPKETKNDKGTFKFNSPNVM